MLAAMPEAIWLAHYKSHCDKTVMLATIPVADWLDQAVSTRNQGVTGLKAASPSAMRA
jgi:hypothetical protein